MTESLAHCKHLVLLAFLLVASVTACVPGGSADPNPTVPDVAVSSPSPGQQVVVNQQVVVTSQSVDPDGIQRVELWADGAIARVDVNPAAASPYGVAQTWQSDKVGTHVFIVKAYDARGNAGQSNPVVITVDAAPQPTQTVRVSPAPPTAEPPQTQQPRPVATATPPPPPTWTLVPPPPTVPVVTLTPMPVCTPPPCRAGEVYYCPATCPGGCGTECATPAPTATRPTFRPTDLDVHALFKTIWDKPEVNLVIGYPTAAADDSHQYARQYFERGYMYWWNRPDALGLIWVVQMPDAGAMTGFGWIGPFEDTWDGDDPISCDAARHNANGPRSGFGRLWCDHPEIAQTIGAAREPERGTGESVDYGVVQMFQGGTMLFSPLDREVWVLVNGGAWQRYYR
jgi:hypothetical protein